MKYISFGQTGKSVSTVVLGLMRITDLSVDEVEKLIDTALDLGINALDEADIYGGGKSEEMLGEVFSRRPDLREKVWLQSKCGIHHDGGVTTFDFSKEYILESVDGILSRAKTDHLDCLLLHRPDALMEPNEVAEAFDRLHTAGKVLDFGVSNCSPMQMELLRKLGSIKLAADQVQFSLAHTPMIDAGLQVNMHWDGGTMRDGGVLEYCRLEDLAVQTWSSLQYGYFEGVFLGSEKYPELNRVLDRIAGELGVTAGAVAIAWLLRYPAKMQSVVGTTKTARLRELAAAADIRLTRRQWYELYQAAGNRLP